MRSLAEATSRFGLGEAVEDLPEEGPVETRETVRAFNLMRGRLDRYVRDRTAMLAAVSHDLRTPITSLRLHAELVGDSETKTKIYAALDEMQRMIEDTLAFIREDMQREETRKVDLNALIDSVAADLAELGHDIEVTESGRVLIICRPMALRRALRNLLENAAIYGTRATVRIDTDDAAIHIVVEDEGPGIPEEDQERVFDPFVRLEASRSRDTGGKRAGAGDRAEHRPGPWRRRSSRESGQRRVAGDDFFAGRRKAMRDAGQVFETGIRAPDCTLTARTDLVSSPLQAVWNRGTGQDSAGLRTVSGVGRGGIACESPRSARAGSDAASNGEPHDATRNACHVSGSAVLPAAFA